MTLSVRLRRLGYRAAFRLLQVYWLLAWSDQRGVKCLLCDVDRVLLVRHTYGSRAWDVPGGSIRRGEASLAAARREMEEELALGDAGWASLGELHGRVHGRRDRIHLFGARLRAPELRLDLGELAVAAWFATDRLPLDVSRYVGPVIEAARSAAILDAPRSGGGPGPDGASATPTRSSRGACS